MEITNTDLDVEGIRARARESFELGTKLLQRKLRRKIIIPGGERRKS